ncbi:Protein CBG16239 [Caenorhabditis briggsae]|uniref:Protein CBG16239 n=1 Tax=Caenorhabditis briggsae TaxID=6238 RepID=A8XNU4_CAEBR|nr:Protein CBG16239 [Caenorhabditis briggsae]CAP34183.2 Protein CBG16239 [Caenorhabditis briggsae]
MEQKVQEQLQRLSTSPAKPVGVKDFQFLKVVGIGGYGKVYQVREKSGNHVYALKIIRKTERPIDAKHLKDEIRVLKTVHSPFLCRLHTCFETEEKVYLVMEFLQGGELYTLLNKLGKMSEIAGKFYIAGLVLALEHLHDCHVVYRDLKPVNVMLDGKGQVRLTDFGLSKFNFPKGAQTRTFCGTPEYMAPEVIKRKPYDHSVDVYSLGCVIYDMLTGGPPFQGKTEKETTRMALKDPLLLPSHLSIECQTILISLIKRDPQKRMGLEELKTTAFFRGTDWQKMKEQGYLPPYIPSVLNDEDVSNFEPCFTDMPAEESPVKKPSEKVKKTITENVFAGFDSVAQSTSKLGKASKRLAFKNLTNEAGDQ